MEGNVDEGAVLLSRYTEAMKFRVVLEYDAEAKAFSAVCPELPGCASTGDTEEEARRNIKEAIELYLNPPDIELPASLTADKTTDGEDDGWQGQGRRQFEAAYVPEDVVYERLFDEARTSPTVAKSRT
jgi:predicted RNase H-like HicB family nuclease